MQSFEDSETTRDRIVATIDPVMEAVASGQMRTTRVALEAVMAYVALVEFWRDDFGDDERENAHNAVEFCMLAATALATSRPAASCEPSTILYGGKGWRRSQLTPGHLGRS
jgi:glycerol-3-phosphate cytidylyltransferase-like family protein